MNPATVVQIAVSSGEDADLLYALCSNGSMWVCRTNVDGADSPWQPIKPPKPELQKIQK